ncbi:MAG TPA: response regulator [Verrucomicrobiae bacterium]|nr:response regulator [Verrucomicrobiae bacterium]
MGPLNKPILLVEDREDDILFFKSALRHAHLDNPIYMAQSGQDALDYLHGKGKFPRLRFPFPSIMMLDLRLPDIFGFDVLQRARLFFERQMLLIVILTAADDLSTIRRAYELGADCYLVKPPRPEDLLNLAKGFRWHWGTTAEMEREVPAAKVV